MKLLEQSFVTDKLQILIFFVNYNDNLVTRLFIKIV